MNINLGFSQTSTILENCSPCKAVTSTTFNRIGSETGRMYKILSVARQNLENQRRLLYHCIANGVEFFRVSPKLIPLAHLLEWDFYGECREQFDELRDIISDGGFTISAHGGAYEADGSIALERLMHLDSLLTGFGLSSDRGKVALRVSNGGKPEQADNFCAVFRSLTPSARNRVMLENDFKSFAVADALKLCERISAPLALNVQGYHHLTKSPIEECLPMVFSTWANQGIPPQVHYGSPRIGSALATADTVNSDDFCDFLEAAAKQGTDFNIMLESGATDYALFSLKKDIENRYTFCDYTIVL